MLKAFTRDGRFAQVSKDDVHAAVQNHPQLRDWLQNLNQRLAAHQFHFGYRVFDEIAQFIHNADENGMFDDWTDAFDHAVYMKVLPKFNGSHARLSKPLDALLAWAHNPAGNETSTTSVAGDDEEQVPVALSAHPRSSSRQGNERDARGQRIRLVRLACSSNSLVDIDLVAGDDLARDARSGDGANAVASWSDRRCGVDPEG